ncbi:putative G3BP-like protein [Neolecta irregularis DAH-3]|uniref:Putative G3BP-like protein n=1 Tax=Neolecta irregularis (strain DAH-3) TaxID=1198029 RepID=A0A1U7LGC6_NEOID|nr:putative G3BP-like protein [Neolecta irregularis DAH-3]|eukprot:OLL21699.1 putative G3BP-like protein [Neolecta irregularis DAH-3]
MADTHASLEMISWTFVQEYYSFLNKDPARLHRFYTKKSSFLHGHEGEMASLCVGQQEIHDKITKLDFRDCKVMVSNVDCQASANNGIVIMVLGEMSNNGGPSQKFVQTFFLAEQPKGYYVLNDIFRFLNEESDSEASESDEIP